MTVTFSLIITDADLAGFELYDFENDVAHRADNYDHAQQLWAQLGANAQDWSLSAKYNVPDDFDVNMSNDNTSEILSYLDLDTNDLCGSIDADDMAGRCLIALALAPDAEHIPTRHHGANGAQLIDVGRAKGYVPAKLQALLALCDFAKKQGRSIQWG